MRDSEGAIGLLIFTLILIAALSLMAAIANGMFWIDDVKAYRTNAVKHGAAEWRVSPEGETTFHWIENKRL